MKKILLLSDTHSYIDDRIIHYINDADEVWHAGDIGDIDVTDTIKALKPIRAVYGNIDNQNVRSEYPLHQKFVCEEVSVWITHIGGYPPKYNSMVRKDIESTPPQLFICGHSHILKVMHDKKNDVLYMNPGAAGKHGFHKIRTMLRFVLAKGKIEQLEVIELEKR